MAGFIHDKLDIKLLVLYILNRAAAPIDFATLTDLSMCDSGVDYFQFAEAAAELLSATDKTLEEVGRCCGFSDGNYFGKVFKRHMQLSPGCFRKQARLQGYCHVKI